MINKLRIKKKIMKNPGPDQNQNQMKKIKQNNSQSLNLFLSKDLWYS